MVLSRVLGSKSRSSEPTNSCRLVSGGRRGRGSLASYRGGFWPAGGEQGELSESERSMEITSQAGGRRWSGQRKEAGASEKGVSKQRAVLDTTQPITG